MLGEKNVICTFFSKGNIAKDQHDDICNLEVLNSIVYKQYVRKMAKILHTYVKFTPHPQSLDGTSPPSEASLTEFGFKEVNTAIANTLTGISNGEFNKAANPEPPVTMVQVKTMIT
jgi:hypothetical protein